jgi:hypothetical protein
MVQSGRPVVGEGAAEDRHEQGPEVAEVHYLQEPALLVRSAPLKSVPMTELRLVLLLLCSSSLRSICSVPLALGTTQPVTLASERVHQILSTPRSRTAGSPMLLCQHACSQVSRSAVHAGRT